VGRIYQQVRARPRYVVATILEGVPPDLAELDGLEKRQVAR
jgi:undecaprenyl-phosphate 4-deoxy-4-formamido-L-arabinose transferase